MSNNEIIFRNSKGIIQRGKDNSQGLLYCGKQYTSSGGCRCLGCDGFCGPYNGCPCPDCDYTLSYILYCTGEMSCPYCKSMLLRINIFNLKLMSGFQNDYSIICNLCNKSYKDNYIPLMYCRNCNYKICPNCAFSRINVDKLNEIRNPLNDGNSNGEGIVYCGKQYTYPNMCLCGSCDGNCGLYNGCPCPICELILGYNIYLNHNMICTKCSNSLLVKTTLIQLKRYKNIYQSGFKCECCNRIFTFVFSSVFHCFKCDFNLCQICSFDIVRSKNILYPYLPIKNNNISNINKDNDKDKDKKNVHDKDDGDENENMKCVICLENDKSFLFMPCKHVCCCENCSKNLNQCPICRNKIESSFKIYI